MRPRYTPLLFLLLPNSCAARAVDAGSKSKTLLAAQPLAPTVTSSTYTTLSTITSDLRLARAEVGTKDAPVDGLDGKPHSGPFVDGSAEPAKRKTKEVVVKSGEKKKDTITEEDGVMNDKNRQAPKKGTTGVEGGVSEKERDRKVSEAAPGKQPLKKPDSPKEPSTPPLKAQLSEKAEDAGNKAKAVVEKLAGVDTEKPRGAPGIGVRSTCRTNGVKHG